MAEKSTSSREDLAVVEARRRAWVGLSLVAGLGPVTLRRAVDSAFGVLGCLKLSAGGWGEVEGIGSFRAAQIVKDLPRAMREAELVMGRCEALGVSVVTIGNEEGVEGVGGAGVGGGGGRGGGYPALMKDLADAPCVLYVKGRLEARDVNAVAMVGSRACSFYGREQAMRLASLLAGGGVTVVSGGARGVDSAGHEGALRVEGGRTIAVLGCGVDVVYPPENAALFERIAANGAVVSHYPPGTAPNQRHFPERNRVISALSRGVLVIEADLRSGSLITARVAADDHNRPVMALPGRVDNPLSAGPHELLRQGAALVTNLEEILEALGPMPASAYAAGRHVPPEGVRENGVKTSGPQGELEFGGGGKAPRKVKGEEEKKGDKAEAQAGVGVGEDALVSGEERKILAALREHGEAPPDVLIEATGLPAQVILRELTLLTLKGRVRRVDAQTYALPR